MRHSLPTSDVCVRSFLYSFFYCNKSFATPSSEWLKTSLWFWSKTVSFRDHESEPFTISYQFPSLCRIPRVRSLMWGSEPSQQCKDFFVSLFSTLCVTHPAGTGFGFLPACASPLSHRGFLFGPDRGVSFLLGARVLLPQLVTVLGLTQEMSMHISFYPAILNWKSLFFFKHDLSIRTLHDAERFKVSLSECYEFLMTFFG